MPIIMFLISKIRIYSCKIAKNCLSFRFLRLLLLPFFFFCYIMMYVLNIFSAIKKIKIKELKDFIFENYYEQIGFPKDNSYYSKKQQKK